MEIRGFITNGSGISDEPYLFIFFVKAWSLQKVSEQKSFSLHLSVWINPSCLVTVCYLMIHHVVGSEVFRKPKCCLKSTCRCSVCIFRILKDSSNHKDEKNILVAALFPKLQALSLCRFKSREQLGKVLFLPCNILNIRSKEFEDSWITISTIAFGFWVRQSQIRFTGHIASTAVSDRAFSVFFSCLHIYSLVSALSFFLAGWKTPSAL